MGTLIALLVGFYLGGVVCAVQWGFVIEDEDGNEVTEGCNLLRARLALLWFTSYWRR